jgi:Family of unknown function (DUF6325)
MTDTAITHGPLEFYLIGFTEERPGPEVLQAIVDLIRSGTVKLLDLVFARRGQDGELTVIELEEFADQPGFDELDADELGLVGENDIMLVAEAIEAGTSAAMLVVEHVWARSFSQALANAGGQVLLTEIIPAPEVDALIAAAG